jgi:hypothetical protein
MTRGVAAVTALVAVTVIGPRAAATARPAPAVAATVTSAPVTPAPMLTVAPVTGPTGARFLVTLTGWPSGTVQLELCGNAARRGSLDCASAAAVQLYLPASGTGSAHLTVVPPPVGCPCVVRATSVTGGLVRTVPVASAGLPSAEPLAPEPVAQLRVTELTIVADGGRAAYFAFPGELLLRLTVRNDGAAPAEPTLSLLVGRPDRVDTIVEPPPLGTIDAGESRSYLLSVPLPAPVHGKYAVHGRIVGGERPVEFVAETEHRPWGLIALAGLVLLGGAWSTLRPRRRSRAQRSERLGA